MKYGSADRALHAYLDGLEEAQRRGFNPKGIQGHLYALKCPNCGGTQWREQNGQQRCTGFKCGRIRPSALIFIPKSYFHQRRRRSRTGESLHAARYATSALDALADLGLVFKAVAQRKPWQWRALLGYVVFGTYDAALEKLERRWPRGPDDYDSRQARADDAEGWTQYGLRELVRKGRQTVEIELDHRGLL